VLFVGFDLQAFATQGYFALSYAALVGTFSGFMLSFYIIKRFGATASAMTAYVIPIVAGAGRACSGRNDNRYDARGHGADYIGDSAD
jgi:drug/metabolite transporter (DMT)-like permease